MVGINIRQHIKKALGHLSVKSTLWIAFIGLLLGTLIVGTFSLIQMRRLNASTERIYHKEYAITKAAGEIRGFVLNASRSQTMLLTASTPKERDQLGSEIDKAITKIEDYLAQVKKLSDDEDRIALHSAFVSLSTKWSEHLKAFVKLVKEQPLDLSKMDAQVGQSDTDISFETRKIEKIVNELVGKSDVAAKQAIDEAIVIYDKSFVLVAGATGITAVFAIALSLWVARRVFQQLGGEPAYAKQIASHIAQGDLSQKIALKVNDADSLLLSLHHMQLQLAKMVSEINESAGAIASASEQISIGNSDLSQRTERQTISLESTVHSVDKLTNTVGLNAENAQQASGLAAEASKIATRGGDVINRVVATMNEINGSAKSITDIISVIEGIAFQTNILALNAAVEAARAGEQGRGFSVVASEVRSLAQRSAVAAKEINQLIATSVRRIENGSTLVTEAGATMAEIVHAVGRVTNIMESITSASHQQNVGIREINQAVAQIGDSTQQNAALVEQAAAASQSVADQASTLKKIIGQFKLA